MPLNFPTDTQWPPAPYDEMLESMKTWAAWWAGDTDRLTDIYTRKAHYRPRTYGHNRQTPGRDNDVFFWGRPNDEGTKRRHVTVPASVSRASAALLFARPPRISPGEHDSKDKRLADRMDMIFGPDAYGGELISAAEMSSALGGVYLRPWWDKEVTNHVVPSHVAADCAVPEFRFDRLVAVTFWTIVSKKGDTPVLRHLERHEKGKIYHGLYSGTDTHLGERVDLDQSPATSWLVGMVDEDGGLDTGLDTLDVVYIPNVMPNRTWHETPGLAPLGRSDFDGIEAEFDAIDEVYASWMRDVEDAKSRIFLDETVLDDNGPGGGVTYDPNKHLYTKLKAGLGAATDGGGDAITDIKFDIRWSEHAQTMAEIKQHVLEHVGLSPQHFADGPLAVGVTATEVNSRNNITETTRGAKINFWQRGLTKFVEIVMKLDAIHYDTGLKLTGRPTVRFSAQHTRSESEIVADIATKRSAGVMSQEQGVKEANPDWNQTEVDQELEKIREDAIRESKIAFGEYPGGPGDPTAAEEEPEDLTKTDDEEDQDVDPLAEALGEV